MLFLQLSVHSSCDRVEWCRLQTMRGPFFPLGEVFRIFPSTVSGYPVSPVLVYLGDRCATHCYICGDNR